jgi:hypothetical protein
LVPLTAIKLVAVSAEDIKSMFGSSIVQEKSSKLELELITAVSFMVLLGLGSSEEPIMLT